MKKVVGFLLLLILFSFSACSDINHKPSNGNNSSTVPSDCSQMIEEVETNCIKIGDVVQIPTENLTFDDFGYGYGTPSFDVEWIDSSKAILCVYKINDIDYTGICKIFLLDIQQKSLLFLCEQTIIGSTNVDSFVCDGFAYVCFSNKHESSYLEIDLEKITVTTGVISHYNSISPTGLILLKDSNDICIKKFNSDLAIYSFSISTNQTFINWSPNGKYVLFQQMDNDERSKYFIYNLSGSLISSFEFKSDSIFKWCNNSEDIIIESYSNNIVEHHKYNIRNKKLEQISNIEDAILIESSFSIFLNQGSDTEIMLHSNSNNISTGIRTALNYNIIAKYNHSNNICIIEIKENNNIYLYTVEVLMGM